MLNSHCSNKNCRFPAPQILNGIKKSSKLTWQQLAKDFETSERTLRRHARQSEKEQAKVKKSRGRRRKIDGVLLDWLHECAIAINKIKVTNQRELANLFNCSQSTICSSLKRAGVVYKNFTYQSIEQLRLKNKAKINYFINVTLPYLLSIEANIFFLDETGFHCNMVSRRGYGWKGLPIIKQKLGERGKNHTLMFLTQIAKGDNLIHWKLIEGAMKTQDFHKFLTDFNPPDNGKKNVLIMDNLRIHKATKACERLKLSTIAELLASKGVEPIYLPSYTPELNPVEKKNNILKNDVRKDESRTKEKLFSIIEERVKFFQKEDLTKYLDNSVKECLLKLNATNPTENDKLFWNTKQWNNSCLGGRYWLIIAKTFRLQNTQSL